MSDYSIFWDPVWIKVIYVLVFIITIIRVYVCVCVYTHVCLVRSDSL